MYALDTNTVIYFFKGMGQVASHIWSCSPKDIFIPAIVAYELEVGIQKTGNPAQKKKQLEQLLDASGFIPFDRKESVAAAQIRNRLEKKGEPIGPLDTLIAGSALAHHLTLVTHNTHEFKRVAGLKIVDWFE